MLRANQLGALRDYVAGDPNVAALYLFGSDGQVRYRPMRMDARVPRPQGSGGAAEPPAGPAKGEWLKGRES